MSAHRRQSTNAHARQTFIRAVLLLVVLFVLMFGIEYMWDANAQASGELPDTNTAPHPTLSQQVDALFEGNVPDVLSSYDVTFASCETLPQAVQREITPGLTGEVLVAHSSSNVIGIIKEGETSDVLSEQLNRLQACGWHYVESNNKEVATCVKNTGTYTWIALQCIQSGNKAVTVCTFS